MRICTIGGEMKKLKLEITSMDDVRVLTSPPPPGLEFRLGVRRT